MAARKSHSFLTFFLVLVLCVNLLNVQTVHADGEPPTEPPVPTQVETEPPTEEPVATQVETEAPTEVPVEETPTPVESTPEPVETEATATPVAEFLTQIPEGTEVVVIDEDGETLPLAADAALEIAEAYDPMWCPAGVLPGGPGCTTNFLSIGELITELISNVANYSQNGIIYFVATTGSQTTGASLNLTTGGLGTGNFNTLNDYNLTLQGGWNGANGGSATFTGTTNFGANSINVGSSANPWAGNITLNNFSFNNGTVSQVNVYTSSGDITLDNVDVLNHGGGTNTAILNSNSGDITVQNGSTFDGDDSNSNGFVATTGTGSISISDTSFTEIVRSGGGSYDGATLSAPTVTLTNVTARDNEGNGITINNANFVNLTNVTSGLNTNNTGNGLSGVRVNGTGSTVVSVGGGVFADNGRYGIEVTGGSIFLRSTPTCPTGGGTRNGNGCYSPNPSTDPSAPVISSSVSGTPGANGWYISDVTVSWTVSDPQSGILSSTCSTTTLTSETTGTPLTCSATNGAGLTTNAAPVVIKIDKTAPTAVLSVTGGTAGSDGWYRSDVTVHTSGTESVSGPITCTADQFQAAETAGTDFNGSCTNDAGLTGNASTLTIRLDSTNPAITYSGRTASNSNGWNNTNVTVNWTCSDATSGPVSDNVSQTVATEGAGQSVTGTCTDLAGNTASDTQGGINIDKTAPLLSLPSGITAEATSSAGAVVTYSATVDDNLDPNVTVSCDPASGSSFPFGASKVGCSSTDQADNTANGGFLVTVGDTTGPVIAGHADVTVEATSGDKTLVTYDNPTATDAVDEGPIEVTCSPESNTEFSFGDTTVTCTAQDSRQNESTSTFAVHVVDTTPPQIADHADVTEEATGPGGALVNYTNPTANDIVDGPVEVSCSPLSNTQFAFGDTTVTCEATDQHENTATSTFVVHVVDTTAPIINPASDVTEEATSPDGAFVSYVSPAASDAVDQSITVTCTPASGTQFELGNTPVTCNAMDEHGNTAVPVSFTVHVVDTTAPTFGNLDNLTVPATSAGGAVVTFSVTASDTVDTNVAVSCSPASGSLFAIGDTEVACTATDDSGNETPGSFFVNVYDPDGPILSLPANMTVEATSASGAKVNFTATAVDIVDGNIPVTCTPASGSTFGFGTTTVTCSAMDSSEISNSGSFLITVQDTTAPVIAPRADFSTVTGDPAGVIVTYASPFTTDAVDGVGIASCTPVSGTLFPIGETTITCTASDSHGNTSTRTFLIRVELSTPGPIDTETPETGSSSIIPLTGGLIDLDCNSVLWALGIKLSFFNLCDYQTALHGVGAGDLPAALPDGFSFVMGLNVDILSQGQSIDELPDASGIEMDFPTYGQSPDGYAVLFWSEADGKWVEVSGQIDAGQITQTLNASTDDELYQVISSSLSDLFYQILTTRKTGVFVLVKK